MPLVRSVHLVRNVHKERPWILNIKLGRVFGQGRAQKYLYNCNAISQKFFSRVEE